MKESLTNANQEIKRVDHLIYVSLKYTRTADVLRNVIERMINALDFILDAQLIHYSNIGTIAVIPTIPAEKCQILKQHSSNNEQLMKYVNFYLLLRKVLRCKYKATQEFRRHLTMSVNIEDENRTLDIDIDLIYEYYEILKEFFDYTYHLEDEEEKD